MKLQEAMDIIEAKEKGFMVHFEKREGGTLRGGMFPDKHLGEELIKTEAEAWELAEKFASAADKDYVNIYVIGHNFCPVANYETKTLRRYPANNA